MNYLGWLGASLVLMLLLSLLPTRAVSEAVPATLWAWTLDRWHRGQRVLL